MRGQVKLRAVNTRSPTTPLLLFHPGANRLKSFGLTAFHKTPTCRISLSCQETPFCNGEAKAMYPERTLPPTSRGSFLVLVLCSCRAKWLSAFFKAFHQFSDNWKALVPYFRDANELCLPFSSGKMIKSFKQTFLSLDLQSPRWSSAESMVTATILVCWFGKCSYWFLSTPIWRLLWFLVPFRQRIMNCASMRQPSGSALSLREKPRRKQCARASGNSSTTSRERMKKVGHAGFEWK